MAWKSASLPASAFMPALLMRWPGSFFCMIRSAVGERQMLPRQTMSMLWYMILFSVYGLKKKRESDYKVLLFRLCGVYGFCMPFM